MTDIHVLFHARSARIRKGALGVELQGHSLGLLGISDDTAKVGETIA